MRLFEPHIHMSSRTTDDYEAMARAGLQAVVEPSSFVGQPRTHVGTFEDGFASLVGWERFRASRYGLRHFCMIGLNPREANDEALADAVMAILPAWLDKDGVVGVGEIGFDEMSVAEERVFVRHLDLARRHELPILVRTPQRDRKRATERLLALVRDACFPEAAVLFARSTEETTPLVLDRGCWAAHTVCPSTRMDERWLAGMVRRFGLERVLVDSAADWGPSEPLAVPMTVEVLRQAQVSDEDLDRLFWDNPVEFYGRSGRLNLTDACAAPTDPREAAAGRATVELVP